jgi:hypothetical protein
MKAVASIHPTRIKIKWSIVFILLSACVDKIDFNVPSAQSLLVVEGMISDSPGPYTVYVSKSISLNADSSFHDPVQHAIVKLFDDGGNSEDFTETSPGEYSTAGVIQGQQGHSYFITLETEDGKTFKSAPDLLSPVGEIEEIRFEFEARTIQQPYGEEDANVFQVYVDAHAGAGDENYTRWRYTGTYKVVTNPEQHMIQADGPPYRDPLPCSGYILEPALGGGKLVQVGPCTCCTCWVNEYESEPHLSDNQLVSNNEFRNVKVAEVSINSTSFSDKYMVTVDQMSLSRTAFDFFKLIRIQKDGASSLFQPPSGQLRGNITAVNTDESVVGLFWATAIQSKYIFIQRSDVPYQVTRPDPNIGACTGYKNSTTKQPKFWE